MPKALDQVDTPEARTSLLHRIMSSPHFAHAYSLRRILAFLAAQPPEQPPKEYEIAVRGIGRPESFDPKADPIIRVSMAGIRERLRAYFENEGAGERVRVSIPKGQYKLCFSPAEPAAALPRAETQARRRFWDPYLAPGATNILVYTEVLFFRDHHGNFVRNIFVNDLAAGAPEFAERGLKLELEDFRPSFHFVSAGEMHSLLSLSRAFQEIGAPLDIRNSRFFSWTEMQGANLILLGSARTNPFLNSLQGKEPFVITPETIVNQIPAPGEPVEYRGRRFYEGMLERVEEWALITRRPGLGRGTSITLVAANHGRAIEGAGHFIAREDGARRLMEAIGAGESDTLPAHFQVLLRVDMIDFVEEVVNVEYVSHRVVE